MGDGKNYNVEENISISKEPVDSENIHGLYWSYVKIQIKMIGSTG